MAVFRPECVAEVTDHGAWMAAVHRGHGEAMAQIAAAAGLQYSSVGKIIKAHEGRGNSRFKTPSPRDPFATALVEALGETAFVDAAGTAAPFNAIVRVADATGIPIDEFKEDAMCAILNDLGVEDFPSGPAV